MFESMDFQQPTMWPKLHLIVVEINHLMKLKIKEARAWKTLVMFLGHSGFAKGMLALYI